MKVIAHRGLINGPQIGYENYPKTIEEAIDAGFDVEIDLRYEFEDFWLGHDKAEYKLSMATLEKWASRVTVYAHCKTIYTLQNFLRQKSWELDNVIPFYHDNDDCIVLCDKTIWVHPNSRDQAVIAPEKSIFVLPRLTDGEMYKSCYGVCTDFAESVRDSLK